MESMNKENKIKDMVAEERPYERWEKYGAEALTDIELLAILLRTGTKGENALDLAKKILYPEIFSNNHEGVHLQNWTRDELMKIHGIGKVKTAQIMCLCELSKRLARQSAVSTLDFSDPDTIAEYYMEDMRHRKQEYMKLIMLNTRTKLIGETDLTKGTVNMSLVSPRELFIEALNKGAVYIVLLHNHPSGDPTPSKEDIVITRRIKEAGKLIGVELLDHIIIGDNCYISLVQEGLLRDV